MKRKSSPFPESSEEHAPEVWPRQFEGRRIVLAVTGGIAAYKSCYIVRELVRGGGQVQVLMSAAAKQFVTPLTFATLSGRAVVSEMFPETPPTDPVHLVPTAWGEVMAVAPATADFIGKLANGLVDDIPSAVALAFQGKLLLAPAMNPRMWSSPAVQENVATLRRRGVLFIGPAQGEMGGVHEEAGLGRMSEPDEIVARVEELLADASRWAGRKILVTSGPTREPIDPVRFVSNRSSGLMGDAIARAARLWGAEVFLVRGKGATSKPPAGVIVIEVDTAEEMSEAVKAAFPQCDMLLMAAAVADWKVANPAAEKMKKVSGPPRIEWTSTEDILSWAGAHREKQVVVGFALETEAHIEGARHKLEMKNADVIVLNDPTRSDSTFGGDTIRLILLTRDSEPNQLPLLPKRLAAEKLLEAAGRFLLN